jgi:hypothetical protein
VTLADLSTVAAYLAKVLSDFCSVSSNFIMARVVSQISTKLGLVLVELSHVTAQFRSIFE